MLRVDGLHKDFAGQGGEIVQAVANVSFDVAEGAMFTLLGPSGCGKTTTLRCIAGLERARAGTIEIGEQLVYSAAEHVDVPVHARDIGMVFQSYAVWPHMSVFDNVSFPLRVQPNRPPRAEIKRRVMDMLERVQLDEFAARNATRLSGGQQQRLALARALVKMPRLWLLDEPLSNLDAKLRELMRFELKKLQRDLNITSLYVTHDQFEALALSDEIAVMRDGHIQQIGSPKEIYERPANRFVADFIGSTNFIPGTLVKRPSADSEEFVVKTGIGLLHCRVGGADIGADVVVAIRPEHVRVDRGPRDDETNRFDAEVVNWVYLGETNDVEARIGETICRVKADTDNEPSLGQNLSLYFPSSHCVVLPGKAEATRIQEIVS